MRTAASLGLVVLPLLLAGCPVGPHCIASLAPDDYPPGGGTMELCGATFRVVPAPTSRIVVVTVNGTTLEDWGDVRLAGDAFVGDHGTNGSGWNVHFAVDRQATASDPVIPSSTEGYNLGGLSSHRLEPGEYVSLCGTDSAIMLQDARAAAAWAGFPGGIETAIAPC